MKIAIVLALAWISLGIMTPCVMAGSVASSAPSISPATSSSAAATTTDTASSVSHLESPADADQPDINPVLSANARWAGVVLILIAGLLVMAAVIGPVVRMELPREVPPAHSHDEPPGSSGHHGSSGMINPRPRGER